MGHYKGRPQEKRALDAYVKLMRAAESVTAHVNRRLDAAGLTVSQFGVLEALHHLGPLFLSDLARKILKTSGNLTMVVDNLEKRGLASRCPDATDRRFVRVSLTPRGKKLIAGLFPAHAREITRALSALSPAEQAALAALCRKLGLAQERP
jgi:MarR family 2-MHQ and catechol resistance regulon transcriptional repressor